MENVIIRTLDGLKRTLQFLEGLKWNIVFAEQQGLVTSERMRKNLAIEYREICRKCDVFEAELEKLNG